MKPYFYHHWNQYFDLRVLLVGAVLLLVVSPWRPMGWDYPSVVIKNVGLWLAPAARTPPDIALLTVDRPELALWSLSGEDDDQTDHRLPKALKALSEQSKTIGFVLPYPVDAFDRNTRHLESHVDAASEGLRRQIDWQVETRQLILDHSVVLGLSSGRVGGQPALPVQSGHLADFPSFVHDWLWPVQELVDNRVFPASQLHYFPLLERAGAEQPLLYSAYDDIHSGFTLALLQRAGLLEEKVTEPEKGLDWRRSRGLTLGDGTLIRTSPDGTVVPLVAGYSTMLPSFAKLSLEAAIARPVNSSVVLIGSSFDPGLERVASTLVAVAEGLTLTEPYWYSPLSKASLVILLALLLFLVPRMSWVAMAFLTCAAAALMVALQLWAQLSHQWWTPMADVLWYLAFGVVVMQLWQKAHGRYLERQRRLGLMTIAHAQRLTELGELEHARQMLLTYAPGTRVYKPYLTLAEAFASRGHYTQALETVAQLQPPDNKQDELREKQEQWARLAETQGEDAESPLANTLVMELQGPVSLGRYEIQKELGRGAMGTVYLAYDPMIARKVAIKTLNFKHFEEPQLADLKARFHREAAAAGRLNHPHIVSVFDVGEEQDLAYIAMDYVDGQPLSKFVSESSLLSPFEAYRAVANVARALHYAHQNNVIHRDIKPANIIYCAEPYQLKVTDFGIARLVDDSRTSTGEILGSPLYIAPEQLQGKTVTPSADVFSLGVTFYQLLTGQLPFRGDSLASLTYDIIYGKPQSVRKIVPGLPSSATRIVNRALQKDTGKRFETALEMAEAIEKAMRRDFASDVKAAGLVL